MAILVQGNLPKKRTTIWIDPNIHNNFKTICFREDVSMSNKIETFMARYNAVHLEGNPQLRLLPFMGEVKGVCFRCEGKFKVLHRVKFVSGLVARVCKECLKGYKKRGLVKRELKV